MGPVPSYPDRVGPLHEKPAFVYKTVAQQLAEVVAHVFNVPMTNTVFPAVLTLSRFAPLFKSGDKNNPKKYRPISGLIFYRKVSSRS